MPGDERKGQVSKIVDSLPLANRQRLRALETIETLTASETDQLVDRISELTNTLPDAISAVDEILHPIRATKRNKIPTFYTFAKHNIPYITVPRSYRKVYPLITVTISGNLHVKTINDMLYYWNQHASLLEKNKELFKMRSLIGKFRKEHSSRKQSKAKSFRKFTLNSKVVARRYALKGSRTSFNIPKASFSIPSISLGDTVKLIVMGAKGTRRDMKVYEGVVTSTINSGTETIVSFSDNKGLNHSFRLDNPAIVSIDIVRRGVQIRRGV